MKQENSKVGFFTLCFVILGCRWMDSDTCHHQDQVRKCSNRI